MLGSFESVLVWGEFRLGWVGLGGLHVRRSSNRRPWPGIEITGVSRLGLVWVTMSGGVATDDPGLVYKVRVLAGWVWFGFTTQAEQQETIVA